jgi:hypothetical protein
LFSILLATFAAACFDPVIQEGVRCSEKGSCPQGLICELSANICLDPLLDDCATADSPCGPKGRCVDGVDEYTCVCDAGYQNNGTTCELILYGLVGDDTVQPRHWEDGTYAGSCHAYLAPELPYVYQGSTGDGMYLIQPTAASEPRPVYCDMTTDGGGWTRMVFWDREGNPELHTLESLQAQLVDEITEWNDPGISRMSLLIDGSTDIQWADVNSTFDALAYRRDIDVPNRGDLLLDVHYYGKSMEQSAIWLYVTASGEAQDVLCRSGAGGVAGYSEKEALIIPDVPCQGIQSSESFTWDSLEQRALGSTISSFHLRSLHGDADADRSHLYRLIVWIR